MWTHYMYLMLRCMYDSSNKKGPYILNLYSSLGRFLFLLENRLWNLMQVVSLRDNLHEMSKPIFWETIRKISWICRLLNLSRACEPLKRQENLHLKMSSVYVVCWIFLQTFQTYILHTGKQYGPRSDCPSRSSLIWVHVVCKNDF